MIANFETIWKEKQKSGLIQLKNSLNWITGIFWAQSVSQDIVIKLYDNMSCGTAQHINSGLRYYDGYFKFSWIFTKRTRSLSQILTTVVTDVNLLYGLTSDDEPGVCKSRHRLVRNLIVGFLFQLGTLGCIRFGHCQHSLLKILSYLHFNKMAVKI